MPWWMKFRLMAEAGGANDDGAGGGAGAGAGNGSNGAGAGDGSGAGAGAGDGGAGSGGDGQSGAGQGNQGAGDGKGTTPTWPENWRDTLAKGDEKRLARLSRYASPDALADALIAAQNRISSGELKSALPKDASPEVVAQWRAENGIPESPDKYDLTFDNGLVVGEDDKPIIDGFLKSAHGANYTPAQAKAAVQWYYDFQKEQQTAAAETFKQTTQQTEDALRSEWGNEYRGNINAIEGLIDSFLPGEDADTKARIQNGVKTNAAFAKMMAGIALQLNPAGTLINAGNGGDLTKSVADEIAKIETFMRTNRDQYNKDEAMQEKYRRLVTARESYKTKAA